MVILGLVLCKLGLLILRVTVVIHGSGGSTQQMGRFPCAIRWKNSGTHPERFKHSQMGWTFPIQGQGLIPWGLEMNTTVY